MNNRWATFIAASLVIFASFAITWQFRHYDGGGDEPIVTSLALSFLRGKHLAQITNIVDRSQEGGVGSGTLQYYDLVLPKDARVFMTDMTGPTNNYKIGYYHWETYYLFPREIGTSLDHITRLTNGGFLGETSESDQEILAHGFDVRFDLLPREYLSVRALRDLPLKFPNNPAWFDSNSDKAMAFLLPGLTALAGMWLFRFLFSTLSGQMPLLEQLACALGLGMMAVAALTLGVKLCGFSGRGLILSVTAVGGIAEMWRNRKLYLTGIIDGCRKTVCSPGKSALFVSGLFVFLILFRLAGLQGLVEPDAVMAWMLKAKILHLYNGRELVQWFSNPRLAHAHLDYPTLVPSLHAATFDSIGHPDEFVTKFWPTWMLLFLLGALASLNRVGKSWATVASFALLGLLLMPATQLFVQWEGSTLPMVFFTVLGFAQCALWLAEKDRARLGLGLALLLGAAMVKLEGFIFLALVGGWIWLLPSARPSLKPSPRLWRVLAFGFLAALPFACLRVQIPSLHYESGWAGYALHDPGTMLSNWSGIFMMQFARLFVNPDFANWSGAGGRLTWIGRWDGISSLYNHLTLGLAWLCLWLTVALWFAVPARRRVIVWVFAMFVGATAALSGVYVSLISIKGLAETTIYTHDLNGGRYLLPVLLAWFTTMMTLFFADRPPAASTVAPGAAATAPPASAGTPGRSLPALKHGGWLAIGALLIVALGVFVLPKNESPLPENSLPSAAAANSLNNFKNHSLENAELQRRNELAIRLQKAGKFAEALQEFREAVRLCPDDPMALNNLAWSLASNPRRELRDGKEAVRLASKAVELTGQRQAAPLATLAAAYAEDGQFARAVEMAKKARDTFLLTRQLRGAVITEQFLQQYSAGKAVGLTN
jgi:hypothetical protein